MKIKQNHTEMKRKETHIRCHCEIEQGEFGDKHV